VNTILFLLLRKSCTLVGV